MLRFEWDETKNATNLRKHGVDFDTASLVFDDTRHLMMRDRMVDGEERWQTIGVAAGTALLLVAHTYKDSHDEEVVRIISARVADARDRRRYEDGF